jgi:pSer/pThr/pTyr-binding forkhead associated (FHA) protein
MSNLALETSKEFYLKALTGGLKGTVFRLSSDEILIGRDPTNHISIPDDGKISRRHARLILNKGSYYIQNLAAKNFIKVNNEKVPQAELKNNYILSIGEQTFKFISVSKDLAAAAAKNKGQRSSSSSNTQNYHSQQKNKKMIYGFVGVLAVLGGYLAMSDPYKVEREAIREIATTEKILERVEASKIDNEDLIEKIEKSGTTSKEYKDAHAFYIKGFRAFQRGLYSTALSNFETCLSLYPEHSLAQRYTELSKNRSEELITFNINQGLANMEKGKFDFCQSSFQNVMASINDKTDPRFSEAKQNLNKCKLLQRSKY